MVIIKDALVFHHSLEHTIFLLDIPFDFRMFVYGTMQYSQAYHQHQQAQDDQWGRGFPVCPKQESTYHRQMSLMGNTVLEFNLLQL